MKSTVDFTKLLETGRLGSGEGQALAAKIGIHPTNVSAILHGDYEPNYLVALALAEHFDTTLDKLSGRKTKPFRIGGKMHPIKALAEKRAISTRKLASLADISSAQLWGVTAGKKCAGIAWLDRVSRALGVSLHMLAVAMRKWDSRP